jgi:acetyl esterase/lipase
MNRKIIAAEIVLFAASLACGILSRATPAPIAASTTLTPETQATPTVNPPAATRSAQPPRPQRENPADHAASVQREVTYCTVEGVELKMDLYLPKDTTGPTPLVVYIHGGGWSQGDKSGGAGMVDGPALLDAGFTMASLNYRLAPEYKMPAMVQDVKCAIRSLRAHAGEYNIDPGRIGVWGGSAGGHLVNMLGTTDAGAGFDVGEYLDQSSRVQAVVDMFGPADLTVDFSGGYERLRESVFGDFSPVESSPVTYITPDDPPFLILQGDADQVVPLSQSREFYDRLAAAGVDAQLVIVKNGPHGLGSPSESPARDELTKLIVQFFEAQLK